MHSWALPHIFGHYGTIHRIWGPSKTLIQCDHLQPCKKFLLITCDRINYRGQKICHIFTEPIRFWYINLKNFNRFSVILLFQFAFIFDLENVRIYIEKVRFLFQISQPKSIPQKWFSTQNEPLDVRFKMKLTPTMVSVYFWEKNKQTPWCNLIKCFKKIASWICLISS